MTETFFQKFLQGIQYFILQAFSIKLFFLTFITLCYFSTGQPFDWVYVAILTMLLAFREGKELLSIWKGSNAA